MERPTYTVVPRNRVRKYSLPEWNKKRLLIRRLYLDESRTVGEITRILAEQHNFHVNNGMLNYRLGEWEYRKNCTKTVVEEHFQSSAHTDTIHIRNKNDMARLLNGAKRHGIQVPSDYTEAPDTIGRYIQSPDVDYQRETMFTSVSHYVGGAFDSEMWDAGNAPVAMVQEYLYWAYGWTQSSFKLLSNLLAARMCFRLDRGYWTGILLRAGFAELNICLRDQPYQALPTILILLNHFREQPPDARKKLLNQCLGLIKVYKYARDHPIKRIFDQVSEMERGDYDSRFCDSMFAQATFCFVDKLSDQLGESGDFVCTVLRNTNQLLAVPGSEKKRSVQRWINPVERRKEDPEYFDSNQNVERCIVQAVELHGHPELLQVREALNQQLNAALNDQVRQILTLHLQALEVPIHRIGYRDSFINGDKGGFVKHWQKLTDNRDLPQDAWDLGYLHDMLFAWKLFTVWGEVDKVRRVEGRLWEIFAILNEQLG